MSDTPSLDRVRLRALAEQCEAKGAWYADNSSASGVEVELWSEGPGSNDDYYIADIHGRGNSAFLTACDPTAILSLLDAADERDRLAARVQELEQALGTANHSASQMASEIQLLRNVTRW